MLTFESRCLWVFIHLFIYLFVRESKRTFNTDGVKEMTRPMHCEWIPRPTTTQEWIENCQYIYNIGIIALYLLSINKKRKKETNKQTNK